MSFVKSFNTVWISLTYDCNNKCEWCYAASNLEKNNKIFPVEKEEGTIDFLSSLGVKKIILIGGEPTLYRNLGGLLEKIVNKEIKVGVISNGRKFSNRDFTKRIQKTGLDYLTISVCGPNAESHDSVTKIKGSFNQSINGIETAIEEGIHVATNTVIGRENVYALNEMVDLLKGQQIKEMTFNICGVCASEDSNNSYLINPQEAVKAFEGVYSYAKSNGIRAKLVTPMPLCFFDKELLPELKEKKLVSGGPCQLSSGKNFVIEYNGDIVPCTHLAHFPMTNIFNPNGIISTEEFIREYNNPNKIPYQLREKIRRYPSTSVKNPNAVNHVLEDVPCIG